MIMVTVIIPTMASRERMPLLKRAVESIRVSSILPVQIITVVNGNRYDNGTCDWLKSQPDILFEYQEAPSAPKAVLRGRELVKSPFFSTLDDDDELLPGATDDRMKVITSQACVDIVLTNGFRNIDGIDSVLYGHLTTVIENPVKKLLECNWLSSCNALYRTESFAISYFSDSHAYGEWTWLAYKMAMDKKVICILDRPNFRINDTSDSLSKTVNYRNSYLSLFERMLDYGPSRDIAKLIKKKMGAACHSASAASLKNGDRIGALKYHLKSLAKPGGLRYLSYSRKLLLPRE